MNEKLEEQQIGKKENKTKLSRSEKVKVYIWGGAEKFLVWPTSQNEQIFS